MIKISKDEYITTLKLIFKYSAIIKVLESENFKLKSLMDSYKMKTKNLNDTISSKELEKGKK